MTDLEKQFSSLLSISDLKGQSVEQSLNIISTLTDISFDINNPEGSKHAQTLAMELLQRELSDEQRALTHYFLANTWSALRKFKERQSGQLCDWESIEIENEITHLRNALHIGVSNDFKRPSSLSNERICQIYTNLGNLLDTVGRFVEGLEYLDKALTIDPNFGMAMGNKGLIIYFYSGTLYDDGHRRVFLHFAYKNLKGCLNRPLYEQASTTFKWYVDRFEASIPHAILENEIDLKSHSMGKSKQEKQYRKWCLDNKLFLNPLNDLGSYPIANRDVLTAPSIVVKINEGPNDHAFYNQIKQEFVSARFLLFEGISFSKPHFSDSEVRLYNTLDYPVYCLAIEKVKAAYRVTYSLLDKIAFFLNHYLELSIPERNISFRTIWYEKQDRKKGVRTEFKRMENWPFQGLFWLSKDLFENKPGFKDPIEPDAKDLNEVRNHLEHQYLKIHDIPLNFSTSQRAGFGDTLAFSLYRQDFESKTLKIMKLVRAALIYLSLGVKVEEVRRAKERGTGQIVPGLPLGTWEDNWKR